MLERRRLGVECGMRVKGPSPGLLYAFSRILLLAGKASE